MAMIINDHVELERFRNKLKESVDNLQQQLKRTDAAMTTVAKSWQDVQFQKYNEEFTKDKEEFPPLCETIVEFTDGPLLQLQKYIEEYVNL